MQRMARRLEVPRVPRSNDRIVAGVAAGWADRWNVEPTIVRAAVALLTLAGGIGAVLYGLAALASVAPVPADRARAPAAARDLRRGLAVLCATGAILVAARAMGLWPGDSIMVAAAAVATGVVVVWSRRDDRPPGSGRAWFGRGLQVTAGVVLLAAGVISLADRTGGLASVGAVGRQPSPWSSAGWRCSPPRRSAGCCARSTRSGRCASGRTSEPPWPLTCTTRCCSRSS